jgi:hypothetical protein
MAGMVVAPSLVVAEQYSGELAELGVAQAHARGLASICNGCAQNTCKAV